MKGLEAYKELKHKIMFESNLYDGDDIVEFEKIDKTIEKELKALEIISKKGVYVELLKSLFKFNNKTGQAHYNYLIQTKTLSGGDNHYIGKQITQEEYDLLKEVLNNE